MKKANSIIVLLFSLIFFNSCNNTLSNRAIKWEEYIANKCVEHLKQLLKDPESYQSIKWKITKIDYNDYLETKKKLPNYEYKFYSWKVVNSYRAKNSFGAYNINEAYFLVDSLYNVEYFRDWQYLPTYVNRSW